ncbi:CHAT domain-containing protein [Actinomadura barringtoniae]|uniref:CHAT domain-containing protein n=1 Tax=Actinomadura barringtoniae TaxID=1427535 RepID=A0A939P5L3_9ACTN|nr:CHAT domain-containing protein [Actinomadura barringtoniae]MBO2445706.1 CHAT domain-containing protein [Actinomadura barringtoniae]
MTGTEPVTMLSVTVNENDGTTRYSYELRTSVGVVRPAMEQEYLVEVNQSLVRDLCGKINKSLKGALQGGPGDLWGELAGYGQTLYDHLFQPTHGNDEPELVAQMRQTSSPLLVRTNEMQVPWELLHDGTEFLGLSHDLGQGSVVRGAFLSGREVGRMERALIVGDPLGDLAAARSEAEHVAEWLTARGTECTLLIGEDATLVDVVARLSSTPYDLLHYCGHVSILNRPADSGLMLHQRRLLNETALRTAAKVGAPPVVFINGCRSAGPIANLCVSFMRMGAKVVVGTRAEVAEASARQFAEEFYLRLLDDQTAGSAVRNARLSLLNEPDGAWASFLLFGDPGVHITGGPVTPAPGTDAPEGPYSPAATEMMRRVATVAEPRGVAISMDLLFGLVTAPELQDTLRRAIGSERLSILTELMHTFVAETPGAAENGLNGTPHPAMSGDVQLSDTVRSVLHQAEDNASTDGRSAVTPHDIATAFAETGGGSASQLLDAFGITPRRLFTPDLAADPPPAPSSSQSSATSQSSASSSLAAKKPTPPGGGGDSFNGDGRLRSGLLDERAAKAVGAALLLAAAKRSVIGSHTLLQGFALADSRVLRQALEAQGEAGRRAAHVLFSPSPRRRDFSRRSLGSIEQAQAERPGEPVGEAAILRGLLTDKEAAARGLLEQLGVDPDQLIRDLEQDDRPADPDQDRGRGRGRDQDRDQRPDQHPDQDRDPGSPD